MARLGAAVVGRLDQHMRQEIAAGEQAATEAVTGEARKAQTLLRRMVRQARLGQGLEKAWQRLRFPRRGRSLGAAALVFSKSVRIHDAFSADRVILARNGRFLVIPLPPAVARGWDYSQARSAGSRPPTW